MRFSSRSSFKAVQGDFRQREAVAGGGDPFGEEAVAALLLWLERGVVDVVGLLERVLAGVEQEPVVAGRAGVLPAVAGHHGAPRAVHGVAHQLGRYLLQVGAVRFAVRPRRPAVLGRIGPLAVGRVVESHHLARNRNAPHSPSVVGAMST